MSDENLTVLADGLLVHEVDAACNRLEKAGVAFEVVQVSADEAGVVNPYRNNWASALARVCNYFNQGGTTVFMRILVAPEDLERAQEAVKPSERKDTDWKTVALWTVGAVILILLLYAFAHPRDRQLFIPPDEDMTESEM